MAPHPVWPRRVCRRTRRNHPNLFAASAFERWRPRRPVQPPHGPPSARRSCPGFHPVEPTKIVCVGRNYKEHAAELGNEVPTEPLLFFKPTSSLLPPGGTILRPKVATRTDYEGELGVVIAKTCHKLADDQDVRPFILGYTCVNDFTARDLQNTDGQWTRAKGFDTFCPVGPSSPINWIPGPA